MSICGGTSDPDHEFVIEPDSSIGAYIDDSSRSDLYLKSGVFTHASFGNTKTIYKRIIKVDCTNKNADADHTHTDTPSYITVTSTVSWSGGQAVLEEQLYNWHRTP
jgi:hypothetical protein